MLRDASFLPPYRLPPRAGSRRLLCVGGGIDGTLPACESCRRRDPRASFWAVLEPVFGAGAFAAGGHRLEQWLDAQSPEAMSFFLAWMRCQAGVRDTDVRGPLDDEPRQAGVASEGRLQHAIAVQREQVEFQRLSTLLEGLPAGHPARSSWLEVDEFAQTLITSWPSATTGVDLGSDDCLCHYFGGLIPS
jgi:hypothetical protein